MIGDILEAQRHGVPPTFDTDEEVWKITDRSLYNNRARYLPE